MSRRSLPPSESGTASSPQIPQSARLLARRFFDKLSAHDMDGLTGLFATHAVVELLPVGITGSFHEKGIEFFGQLIAAFPDLRVHIRSTMDSAATAVVEVTIEGTQAADFLGVLNQEKYLDLDQAWIVTASSAGIEKLRAYWCQNQLYRRLAVRRLDMISQVE